MWCKNFSTLVLVITKCDTDVSLPGNYTHGFKLSFKLRLNFNVQVNAHCTLEVTLRKAWIVKPYNNKACPSEE